MGECDLNGATLTDVLFDTCDLRAGVVDGLRVTRVELRGSRLDGLVGADSLRGVRMPWNDVLEHAPLFATALGIEIVD
jgi:hypothetical protein